MSEKRPRRIPRFSPLDKTNLGESVADAMLQQPVGPLPPTEPFLGAGVYALYYQGNFPLDKDLAEHNGDNNYRWPIYVRLEKQIRSTRNTVP